MCLYSPVRRRYGGWRPVRLLVQQSESPRRIQAAGALGTVIKVVKSDLFTSIENNTRTSEKWTVVTAD